MQSKRRRPTVRASDRSWLGTAFYPRVLRVSLAGWTAFAVLTTFALNATYLPGDLQIARWVQAAPWGPLAITFPWISSLSGTGQVVVAVLLVLVVAAANRRAVPFALIGASSGALYILLNLVIHKPRPIAGLIRVTEHAGSFAFPSGHATLALTVVGVLILTVGVRHFGCIYLRLGAAIGILVVLMVGVERIYVGAHYPSDVLGGFVLAFSVLSLALSLRWVGEPIVRSLQTYGDRNADR